MQLTVVRALGRGRRAYPVFASVFAWLWCFWFWTNTAAAAPLEPHASSAALSAKFDEATASASIPINWEDIIRLVDQHPRVAAGKYQVDAARGAAAAAGAMPNPTVEAVAGQGFAQTGNASRFEWNLALNMPLTWITQRASRVGAAAAEVDAAAADNRTLRRDALLQLKTLFWNLAYEQARAVTLAALETETTALANAIKKKVEKGDARPVEATRVEIELEKVIGEVEAATITLKARQAQLGLWLGVPTGKTVVAVADFEAPSAVIDLDMAMARMRATHPALASANASERSLELEANAEKMARFPSWSLIGFTSSELDRKAYGVGIAVDLPLWNWNSGRIAQAEAKLAAGRKQAEVTALELESTVIEAQAECNAALINATRLSNAVVPRAATAATTMQKSYQLGEASLLELIDARRTLIDARRQRLSAISQAQINCGRLAALVGEN